MSDREERLKRERDEYERRQAERITRIAVDAGAAVSAPPWPRRGPDGLSSLHG